MGYRLRMWARRRGSRGEWRRVGVHKRTGRFVWAGSRYATWLRRRGRLSLSIPSGEVDRFDSWARKHGYVIRVERAETIEARLIRTARAEVGVTEQPLGSNRGPRVDYYRRATTLWPSLQSGWPWCCAFVVRMCLDAGIKLPRAARTASVWHFTEWARRNDLVVDRAPRKGDIIVLFAEGQHIGFCAGSEASQGVATVEGNTTPQGMSGSAYEGTAVASLARATSDVVVVIDIARWHRRRKRRG